MAAPLIRPARPGDAGAIAALLDGAFPGEDEARLCDKLEASGEAEFSLVAEIAGEIVGHVLLSRMRSPEGTLALAPVAVATDYRRRGIAGALCAEALRRAEEEGWKAVFVLGDPAYYARFGFSAEPAVRFESSFGGPAFLVVALDGHALQDLPPRAEYPAPFSDFE